MHMYKQLHSRLRILYVRAYLLSLRLECPVVSKFCMACVVSVCPPLPPEFAGGSTAGPDEDGVDNAPAIVAKARTISDWEPPPVAILNNTCATRNT